MTKGLRRGLTALVLAPLLYAVLGFIGVPLLVLQLAEQQFAERLNVPAGLKQVGFNPFNLQLTLRGLQLGAPGSEVLQVGHLLADLQLDSLWRGELHLRELRVLQLRLAVELAEDGRLNLAQLLVPATAAAEPPADARPFPLRIDRLRLDGQLGFADRRPAIGVEQHYRQLTLSLDDFTTHDSQTASLSLTASGPHGAALDVQGRLGLQPLQASGRFSLGDTALSRWWPYARSALPWQLQDGRLSLGSDYRLEWRDAAPYLRLDNPRIDLVDLQLQQADGAPLLALGRLQLGSGHLEWSPASALSLHDGHLQLDALRLQGPPGRTPLDLESLNVAGLALDSASRRLAVGQLHSRGLGLQAGRERDGRLDWQAYLEQQLQALARHRAAHAAGQTTEVAAPAASRAAAPPPWQLRIAQLQLRGWRARLEDRLPASPVALDLGPLDLDLGDLALPGSQPLALRLDSALGQRGRLQAEGRLQLQPLAGHLKLSASDLDLRPLQAYLEPFVRVELRSGLFGGEFDLDLQGAAPLRLALDGSARIDQLHTLDTLKNRDLVRWQQIRLDGLSYRHGQSLQVRQIALQRPYARFIINEDLSTNLQELMIPQPPRSTPATPGAPLQVRIGGIEIRDGSAHFADLSLTPNFATAIQQLDGRIGRIDNSSAQPATVDIRGKVDRYAPVSIRGQLTPFAPLHSLDIATRFQRVELTTLTPYAGKFAGYKIRKGRLNLDLHYRIEQGRLNADNRVLLEDLQLGERVDSPSATDLPVRLAVALLKDRDGNIDIALPVQGDLNNPEFSVVPIVWQTLRNLVLRAAQAPFALLAGLAEGGSERLDSVPFAAGSGVLDDGARAILAPLARGLQQRPQLRLEVEGSSRPSLDGPLLAARRLEREYQETWYRMLQRRGDKVPAEAGQLQVPDELKPSLLEGIYRARLKQQPPAAWGELDADQRSARLRQAVLDGWAQSPLLLRQLAQERAQAIKQHLVEQGGIDDARIYLLEVGVAEAAGDDPARIAVPLHLDSE